MTKTRLLHMTSNSSSNFFTIYELRLLHSYTLFVNEVKKFDRYQ